MDAIANISIDLDSGLYLEATDPTLGFIAVMNGVQCKREVTLWAYAEDGNYHCYGSIALAQILAPKGTRRYWDGHLQGDERLKSATLTDYDRDMLSNWAQSEALGYEESWEEL